MVVSPDKFVNSIAKKSTFSGYSGFLIVSIWSNLEYQTPTNFHPLFIFMHLQNNYIIALTYINFVIYNNNTCSVYMDSTRAYLDWLAC